MRHKEKKSHIQEMGQSLISEAEGERPVFNKHGSYSNGNGPLRHIRRES